LVGSQVIVTFHVFNCSSIFSSCRNPFVVGLALTYFFVYVVRQGVTSWFVFYLLQVKGVADAGAASLRVSGLELGGLVGSLLAGKLSDILISRAKPGSGTVGKRIQVVIGYTVGVAAMLMAFAATPASAGALQWLTVFMIGFFLYGPQVGSLSCTVLVSVLHHVSTCSCFYMFAKLRTLGACSCTLNTKSGDTFLFCTHPITALALWSEIFTIKEF
jgi:sugar phosphate permease